MALSEIIEKIKKAWRQEVSEILQYKKFIDKALTKVKNK